MTIDSNKLISNSEFSVRDLCFNSPPDECVQLVMQLRPQLDHQITYTRMEKANQSGYLWGAAYIDSSMVGLLGYCIVHSLASGTTLYIHDIVVEENMRSNGIGTELLNFAITKARSMKCDNVQLDASFYRTNAHRFYDANGFEKSGYLLKKTVISIESN